MTVFESQIGETKPTAQSKTPSWANFLCASKNINRIQMYVNGVCTCLCVWLVSFPKFKCLIVIGNVLKMPKQSHFSANQLQKGISGIKVQYLPPKCILSLSSEKHIIQLLPIFTFYHVQNIYIVALQVSVTSIWMTDEIMLFFFYSVMMVGARKDKSYLYSSKCPYLNKTCSLESLCFIILRVL